MLIAHVRAQLAAGYSPCLPPAPEKFTKLALHVPSWRRIARETADKYNITVDDLMGPCRRRMYAWPRQEAIWRCRQETPMSLPDIARRFGDRDHTTALHAVRAYEKRVADGVVWPKPPAVSCGQPPLPVLPAE